MNIDYLLNEMKRNMIGAGTVTMTKDDMIKEGYKVINHLLINIGKMKIKENK